MIGTMRVALAVATLLMSQAHAAEPVALRERSFTLAVEATVREVPEGTKSLELWLPLPQTDAHQTIHRVDITAPGPTTLGREARWGNQAVSIRVDHPEPPLTVSLRIKATRRENAGTPASLTPEEAAPYLAAEPLVPIDGPIRALAVEATRGLGTDADKAKAIYEKVAVLLKYDKTGTGWGRGDALFACDARRGNCTDFHALVLGMARSQGIPARFAIGLSLPEAGGPGAIAGYHCWAELFVEGRGWVPVDASEASKHPERRAYYFGHHDEDRIEFSRGRHLILEPPQRGKPLNFFVYPYAEADGVPLEAIDRSYRVEDANPVRP